MDCRVVVEAAVQVYDVSSPDEAVRISISKTGNQLNPDLNYVEISPASRDCDHCGEPRDPAFVAADEALVALDLEMDVYNVDREEHAQRIARKEIGQLLTDVPLDVVEVDPVDGSQGSTETADADAEDDAAEDGNTAGDDVLPEFDDILEESDST